MADKEAELAKPATPRPGNELSTRAMITAYALGFAGLGAGGVAVFVTHLEAGPVGLMAVGLIFMIIGLSRRLPSRLKIGDNEAEWQAVAGNVIETAVDASPPSVKAQLAPQLAQLAEVAPKAAAPALSGLAYDSYAEAAIAHAADLNPHIRRVQRRVQVEDVGEFDFVLEADGNRFILVKVKSTLRLSMWWFAGLVDKAQFYRQAYPDRKTALLLVSRDPLSPPVLALFRRTPNAECIEFSGSADESQLTDAIGNLLSGLG